jgi:glycosyltransferase involved in cell wall biosynthesis
MKVAYVCPSYPPDMGGVETHVSELAVHLSERGCSVEVFTQRDGPSTVDQLGPITVRRFRAPGRNTRRRFAVGLLRGIARARGRLDIVHAHDYHALPALAAALARPRVLVFTPHYHGFGHSAGSRTRNLLYRPVGAEVFSRSAKVICVSMAEAHLVRRHFPRTRNRTIVIPNGLSLARRSDPRSEAKLPLLVTVGRLERYKNVDAVIRALHELPPSFRLAVIGEGPARRELEGLVARSGLQKRVDLLGRTDDAELRKLLSSAGALVTMSRREAFGLTPLEALAGGVPVVASDIPAYRELRERYGGHRMTLVPTEAAPRALAAAIETAVSTSGQRAPVNVPSWEEVAARTLELYRRLAR